MPMPGWSGSTPPRRAACRAWSRCSPPPTCPSASDPSRRPPRRPPPSGARPSPYSRIRWSATPARSWRWCSPRRHISPPMRRRRCGVDYVPLPTAAGLAAATAAGCAAGLRRMAGQCRRAVVRPGGRAGRRAGDGRGRGRGGPGPGSSRGRAARAARDRGGAGGPGRPFHDLDSEPDALWASRRDRGSARSPGGARADHLHRLGRRVRHQGPYLRRGHHPGRGGAPARAHSEMDGVAAGAFPQRLAGSRPASPRPTWSGRPRAHRGHRDGLRPRPRRLSSARRGDHAEHHQPSARTLPRAASRRLGPERGLPHPLRRRLSWVGTSGGGFRDGAAHRPSGAASGPRSGGDPPAKLRPSRRDAVSHRAHLSRRHAHLL